MAIIKYVNGNFYEDIADQKTVAMLSEDEFIEKKLDSPVSDKKTINVFTKISDSDDPIVGWLVCIKGNERGRDYRIHSGRNFIGRSHSSDINIVDDNCVSRENHCSIVYEPIKNNFILVPGRGTNTYLNKKRITLPEIITDDDLIEIGESTFVFVAYCKGERKW